MTQWLAIPTDGLLRPRGTEAGAEVGTWAAHSGSAALGGTGEGSRPVCWNASYLRHGGTELRILPVLVQTPRESDAGKRAVNIC